MGVGGVFKAIGKAVAWPVTAPAKAISKGVTKGVDATMQKILAGVIRHLITTLGGGLLASGALSGADLEALIGALTTLVGLAWSIWAKRGSATPPVAGTP